jgi:hypothetical protein
MKFITFLSALLFFSLMSFAGPRSVNTDRRPPAHRYHHYHHYHAHRNYRHYHHRNYHHNYGHRHYRHYHARPHHAVKA